MQVQIYVSNYAPYFEEGAPENQLIEIEGSLPSVFHLPSFVDEESLDQSNITVTVKNLESSFMTFNNISNSIKFTGVT